MKNFLVIVFRRVFALTETSNPIVSRLTPLHRGIQVHSVRTSRADGPVNVSTRAGPSVSCTTTALGPQSGRRVVRTRKGPDTTHFAGT